MYKSMKKTKESGRKEKDECVTHYGRTGTYSRSETEVRSSGLKCVIDENKMDERLFIHDKTQ